MSREQTRRTFIKASITSVAAFSQPLRGADHDANQPQHSSICITCGTQFAPTRMPPPRCAICEDERQYVGWNGQQWTTMDEMQSKYRNIVQEEEAGLHSIHTEPRFGIGQRAFLLQTPKGNVLWDCVSLLDAPTIQRAKELGGIAAIAVSHPHYYSSMIEWSRAFHAPIYLHELDRKWVMRPDKQIVFWKGATTELFAGVKLLNTGGHFDGFQVLHWPGGAGGRGALLAGDQPQVCMDRRWLTFMYSYPNYIPLPPAAIHRIVKCLDPLPYERLYGAFPGRAVLSQAKRAVARSAERYLRSVGA